MKDFFLLQYKIANRRLSDMGIRPIFAYVIITIVFVAVFEYLFYITIYAKYVVVLSALNFVLRKSEIRRTEFMQTIYDSKTFKLIRILENTSICTPFLILLIAHNNYIETVLLFFVSLVMALNSFNTNVSVIIPTPFGKNPFEFVVGFRNTFFMFPLAYTVSIIAIVVDNFNLGIFSIMLIFLVVISYYLKPENEYYVWSFSATPSKFLLSKLTIATKYISILLAPSLLSITIFYPYNILYVLLFLIVGFALLWTIILAKYSVYPDEMNLPEQILLIVGIIFPPLLLALAPYFYFKSIKSLNTLLK